MIDSWETLDAESIELTNSSDFGTQVPNDADRMDMGPTSDLNSIQPDENDWRAIDTPEEQHRDNIMHHDCMWAGSCMDSEHPSNSFVPSGLITATPGQSLLRGDTPPPRLDTPPSLDGDESLLLRNGENVAGSDLRLLRDSVAVTAKHSYTQARQHNRDCLRAQTPFDSCESEEEVDVVSIETIHQQPLATTSQLRVDSLPRTRNIQEQHHILNTVENAITRPPARVRLTRPATISAASMPRRRRSSRRRGRSITDADFQLEMERRSIRNNIERLRRISLRKLFNELKMLIPAPREKKRMTKAVILQEAAALCRKLEEEKRERDYLKKQKYELKAKLKKLQAKLAQSRTY